MAPQNTPNTPDNTTTDSENKKKRAPHVVPLWVSLGLLVPIALLGWGIWHDINAVRKKHEQDVLDSLNALIQGRKRDQQCLNDLLAMKDCDIQEALEKGACQRRVDGAGGTGGTVGAGGTGGTGAAAAGDPVKPGDPAKPGKGSAALLPLMEQACVFVLADSGSGSGFFVTPEYVVTNQHVVGKSREVLIGNKSMGLKQLLVAKVVASVLEKDGRDIAVLRVSLPAGVTVNPLVFAAGAKKTEEISTWGYPGVVMSDDPEYARLRRGDLTAIPELVFGKGDINVVYPDKNPPVLHHSAPASGGNSGCPIVNAAGEVVGMHTRGKVDNGRRSGIGLYAPAVHAFLKQSGVSAQSR